MAGPRSLPPPNRPSPYPESVNLAPARDSGGVSRPSMSAEAGVVRFVETVESAADEGALDDSLAVVDNATLVGGDRLRSPMSRGESRAAPSERGEGIARVGRGGRPWVAIGFDIGRLGSVDNGGARLEKPGTGMDSDAGIVGGNMTPHC